MTRGKYRGTSKAVQEANEQANKTLYIPKYLREPEILTMDELCYEIIQWADATFGKRSDRHLGKIKHLREEIRELKKAILANDQENMGEELADLIIIALHLFHCADINYFEAIKRKFKIIQSREWLPADKDGVVRHRK